jgi:hypothetical protein
MFLGHFAVGFASKRVAPRASLGYLIAAPILLDLLWPIFLLLGWERVRVDPGNTLFTPLAFDAYPWSHSLVMSGVWGASLAGIYLWRSRSSLVAGGGKGDARGAWVIALAVVSHWVLDVVTHRPDMPIAPGVPTKLGLGLWNSVPATLIVELSLFGAGVRAYVSMTRARDRVGMYALWGMIVFLLVLYVSLPFTPPPPDTNAIAYADLGAFILPFWAGWIDRHRPIAPSMT